MKLSTYLPQHPEIKDFWLQSDKSFTKCYSENSDLIGRFGDCQIKEIEHAKDEPDLITIYI